MDDSGKSSKDQNSGRNDVNKDQVHEVSDWNRVLLKTRLEDIVFHFAKGFDRIWSLSYDFVEDCV